MRNAFAAELTTLAERDERIVLLSGDIGNRLFDGFKARFAGRFFNCGVAEANMMSLAAGMALSGLRPFVYTIAPFTTTRCLEQIRLDVCYHQAPVTIVGVGAGLSYAANGATHHSVEDIAFLRMLPEMTVLCPGDEMEMRALMRAAMALGKPAYLRIGKSGEPVVHPDVPDLRIGQGLEVRAGSDVCLLSTGNMLPNVLEAATRLAKVGLSARVVSMHTVKPLDERMLTALFAAYPLVVTVEEHSRNGGFGGSVAEWLCDQPFHGRLLRLGSSDEFLHEAGGQEYARERFGLTPRALSESVLRAWSFARPCAAGSQVRAVS
ncbi:MAG: transketolase [Chloroflexota bacterium]|nr:transketolase [Chloroflexota bacterium]